MDPATLGSIYKIHPTPRSTPSVLKAKWSKNDPDTLQECKDAFKYITLQHLAPTLEDFLASVASSSSFRTTSKSKDFTNIAACLAEVVSPDFRYFLRRQYDYTAVRKIRHLLALTIPLYASIMLPGSPQDSTIWRFWDRFDKRAGIRKGMELGQQEHLGFVQEATKEISEQRQGLDDFYNHLLYHPLLSFQSGTKGAKQIPDPVLGSAIHNFIVVSCLYSLLENSNQ
jgi:hypothetical protein